MISAVLFYFLLCQVLFMVLPKTSSCTKSAQADEQANIKSFKEFLKKQNVAYSAIDWPAEFHESGRGVVALRRIEEEEVILQVPVSACIYRQRYHGSELDPLLNPLDNFDALIWVLLFERAKGKASAFWEYINILPKTFSTGDTWSEAEIHETQDLAFVRDSRNRKQNLHRNYNEGMDVLFQNKIAIPEAVTFQNYAWAARAVRSRCFQINDTHDHVMVPMADLLNHKETAPTHWHEINGSFVMWAGPYLPGQEVFGNYRGDFTNYHMALDYGFVLDSNKFNSERIVVPYSTKDRDAKMEHLLQGDDALALHFAINPWDTLWFHRMILAPTYKDPTIFLPKDINAEIQAATYCSTHMSALLTGMPTTIGEDYVQYWTNSTAWRNKRTAVALRMGRKKVYLRQASFCHLVLERVIQCTSSFGLKKPRYFGRLMELVYQYFSD